MDNNYLYLLYKLIFIYRKFIILYHFSNRKNSKMSIDITDRNILS